MPRHSDSFNDRREAAQKARQTLLEKFQARPAPDDPAVLARAEERRRILEARQTREAERAKLKAEEEARIAAEQARLKAEEEARVAEQKRLAALKAQEEAALRAAQKAARDERYARRKARK
jgi:hypothetical protein